MIDTTELTSLINAFRAESREDSISPESLGSILQRIVNLLGSAAVDIDIRSLYIKLEALSRSVSDESEARRLADAIIQGYMEMKADRSALASETYAREQFDRYLVSLHENAGSVPKPDIGGGGTTGEQTGIPTIIVQ